MTASQDLKKGHNYLICKYHVKQRHITKNWKLPAQSYLNDEDENTSQLP